jgi:hypothetical protein
MRFESDRRAACPSLEVLTAFYREEFLKHRECLEHQREYYSERAISDVEAALSRIIAQLETLCATEGADRLVSTLLKKFNAVTNLSAFAAGSDHPSIFH